ncbi:FAD-dependent monooxygenase [Actinoplanes solisilvae]|uniref:FAD-dependent monooxygenase n=1 Tax=Actinoplanes solisilvae TaxID=2486853 RepID=UPI000FD84443|nr:FAD-dependent monooxygenase [Actinoplanes solisilvae]
MQPRILIVGAGISGLALARALRLHGMAAEIVERRADRPADGTGLYLPANAVRALHGLQVSPALAEVASPVRRQEFRDRSGHLLSGYEVSAIWKDVGECLAITHADLRRILMDGTDVRFGTAVGEVTPDARVTFSDGTEDRYDLVVGADGVNSAVRRSVFPRTQLTFLSQICWRLLVRADIGTPDTWIAQVGSRGRTVLSLPLRDGLVYVNAAIDSGATHDWPSNWRGLFADFGGPAAQVLAPPSEAHFAPLYEIRGDDWVRGRTVLIGDAAHACSPSMAQGGALALEDALVLGDMMSTVENLDQIPLVLQRYRERRRSRVRFVFQQNRRRDRARMFPDFVRRQFLTRAGVRMAQANHAGLLAMP